LLSLPFLSAPERYVGQSGRTYEPVERLGPGGGFGSVALVRDEDGADFALKTLHLGFATGVLETEAENLRRVEHENVVRYVDHGADPEPFLVMELARGGTLKDYLAAARDGGEYFSAETLVGWTRQLLNGLNAIHEVLLHRDLKPANVLLDETTLKVADFGLTRLVEASTRTETLKGAGTPVYMPPEGWDGVSGPSPTPAYDLYSLGVILYELATLEPPFGGDRDELRRAHLFHEPRSPRELRSDLPAPLERLILQLLRKTPAQRGGSASACLPLLDAVDDETVDAPPETTALLARLQEGASTLMQEAAQREAQRAREHDEARARRELEFEAADRIKAVIEEARDFVAANIAPIALHTGGDDGDWHFHVDHSNRVLRIRVARPLSPAVFGDRAPGDVLVFGQITVTEEEPTHSRTIGGANIVGFASPEASWVVGLQEIQLRNQGLTQPFRSFEPYYLELDELGEHGRWLWGGAMHVFRPQVRELSRDVLVEWFVSLLP
jgi:hypothetical protein